MPGDQGKAPRAPKGPSPLAASRTESTMSQAPSSARGPSSQTGAQQPGGNEGEAATKKRRKRGKRRTRRQSFAAPASTGDVTDTQAEPPRLVDVPEEQQKSRSSFYGLGGQPNHSNTSLESEALLDHRAQPTAVRSRRQSNPQASYLSRSTQPTVRLPRPSSSRKETLDGAKDSRSPAMGNNYSDDEDDFAVTDQTPLISSSQKQLGPARSGNYGLSAESRQRKSSRASSTETKRKKRTVSRQTSSPSLPGSDYDVNNPPSLPGSPRLGAHEAYDDVMLPEFSENQRPFSGRDAIIDIDPSTQSNFNQSPKSPANGDFHRRRQTGLSPVEDVCLPYDNMTEVGEDDSLHLHDDPQKQRRSRKREWPDLAALEDWSRDEKEERTMEGIRAKKVNEPELIGGRLRPQKTEWRRDEEENPFRWTYFNEELDSSLRSHTISGLQQLGLSFRELFIPDRPEIDEDSSSDDEEEEEDRSGRMSAANERHSSTTPNGLSRAATRQTSILEAKGFDKQSSSGEQTGRSTPVKPQIPEKPKRYGPRPVFWLDVLQPTYEEMRVISRAFGIHKLTAEDIMEQEAREKVELFRNYYFVNYRTFEQDDKSDDYLEPVNMYFVVFKGGVISFHFSQLPHPPNVRRRIRQLAEHQYTDSDWISYAIIDNITDAYAPLIEQIEQDVDDIDEEILQLHSKQREQNNNKDNKLKRTSSSGSSEKSLQPPDGEIQSAADAGRDMLLRVGECRKKVMGLYRLLGNKADVIKGLAKRCNEQWQVAPRTDVGLYLGDIQDHIVTMTGNLTHYENILSRAHSNYLAQINILMNERAEQTGDALNKLTVLGTIVLPMNIITGMWGMNCLVPGQDVDNLWWFFGITLFLIAFGVSCFFVAKRAFAV